MRELLALDGGAPVRTAPFPTWPVSGAEEVDAIIDVLRSGAWGSGRGTRVAEFEAAFARYGDAEHCVCACNGTVALDVALRAVGVGPGDEVIVPPYTFIASVAAILYLHAIPIFADVREDTHLIDAERIAERIGSRTRAIMAVHIAGRPCDMDAVQTVANEHGIPVIEDAAQAHGARWRDRGVGTIGNAGTFSFQSSKNMTAGEGGAIVTNDADLADRLYGLVNVGRIRGGEWYDHQTIGYNLRLTEFQAAVLQQQLRRHPTQQATRETRAGELTSLLSSVGGVQLPAYDERVTAHGRHLFIVRVPNIGAAGLRDRFVDALRAEGVPATAGYGALHRHDAVVRRATENAAIFGLPYSVASCPVTDAVVRDSVWLPQFVLLGTPGDMVDIASAFEKVTRQVASEAASTRRIGTANPERPV